MTQHPVILARTVLVEGLRALRDPLIEERVWRDRTRPLEAGQRLGVFVFTPRESAELETEESARVYLVTRELEVGLVVRRNDSKAFDLIDTVAARVLQFVGLNDRLGGGIRQATYRGLDFTFDRRGETDVVVGTMRFGLEYELQLPEYRDAPDLDQVALEIRIGGDGSPVETLLLEIDQTEEA